MWVAHFTYWSDEEACAMHLHNMTFPHIHDSRSPSQNSRLANPTSFQFDPHQKVCWTHDHLAIEWNSAYGFQFRIA